jgi:signal peptidase I
MNLFLILSFLFSQLPAFSPFMVDGPSMLPNMNSGDIFLLNGDAYVSEKPARGDVVVFYEEGEPDYFYVKRILGLPGERLHVTSKGIYVEEGLKRAEIPEPYLAHAADADNSLKGYKDELFIVPKDKYFVLGDNRAHSLDSRSFIQPFIPIGNIKGKYILTLLDL